jgi:lipopolysaccharide transport system permease protein
VSAPAARASSAVTVIEARTGLAWPNWRELWAHRELIYVLGRRDIAVRYKQSIVGALWAVVQPLLLAVVFSVFFGLLAHIDSGRPGVPYPVFAVVGMVTWLFFTSAVLTVSTSTVSSASLLSKVYFPRLVIPLAALLAPIVDYAIALCVALAVTLAYGVVPPVQVVLLPLIVPLMLALIMGFCLWLSALQVKYRDIGNLVSFTLLVGLFITPIVYPFSHVPEEYHLVYGLNPMVGVMELMRWMVLPGSDFAFVPLVVTIVETTALIVSGLLFFGRSERSFADVI